MEKQCQQDAEKLGLELVFLQSNYEGQLVDWIHETGADVKAGNSIGAVYNPGAHTHYAYAIGDAIEGAIVAGDRTTHLECSCAGGVSASLGGSPQARGIIVGFGVLGYSMAISGLYELTRSGT